MKIDPLAILIIIFATCASWLGFGQDLPAAIGGLITGLGMALVIEVFL